MYDIAALKAADAALGNLSPVDAATALNAQSTSSVQDIPCVNARALLFATGEYGAIVLLSRQVPSDTIPSALVAAAITAEATLNQATFIQASDPVAWAAVQQMLGAFMQAGALSQTSYNALIAMHSTQTPLWPVVLTDQDVLAARAWEPSAAPVEAVPDGSTGGTTPASTSAPASSDTTPAGSTETTGTTSQAASS